MKTLFPEMDKEIASDRMAERREQKQRAIEYLRIKYGVEKFVMDHLKSNGPSVDANMMLAMSELGAIKECLTVIFVLQALWLTGKLWRRPLAWHPSNEKCFTYGIRGIHQKSK